MAIEQGIWKLADSAGEPPRKLRPAGLADEGLLEEQIMQDVTILNRDWLLIGRQVRTAFDKLVDLLAIDASSERIITYLNEHAQLSINAMFFAAFEDGGNRYLSRAWMIDPDEPSQPVARKAKKEPWNGEFYTSFGDDRPWELARRYGFIAGGGAAWYSKTLNMLSEGDRVWVNIPKTGYVGVGEVVGERYRADEYRFETEEGSRTLLELASQEEYPHLFHQLSSDEDEAEFLVPVRWLHTVSRQEAFSEVGLFGNQNTVCKPTTPKWSHTAERLKNEWGIE